MAYRPRNRNSGRAPDDTTRAEALEEETPETKGQRHAKKAAYRQKAKAAKSEAKWYNAEPREQASPALPEMPDPLTPAELQPDKRYPAALAAGALSDTGDKSRNFETSRHAGQREPEHEANRGLSADAELVQNRHADSQSTTNLGASPYQHTGDEDKPAPPDDILEREIEHDASLDPAAASGMAPADELGLSGRDHPGRRPPFEQAPADQSPPDQSPGQRPQTGAHARAPEKQGKTESPTAEQTRTRAPR